MDEFIVQCASYATYDQLKIVTIDNIGQVIAREDGYYGMLVTTNPTPADYTPFQQQHINYTVCPPIVLFLANGSYNASHLTIDVLQRLTSQWLIDHNITFDDFYLPNQPYFADLTLIWMNNQIDHTHQTFDNTVGVTILYRAEYSWFINPSVQNPDVHLC